MNCKFNSTALSNLKNNSMFIFGFHYQSMSGSLMRLEQLWPMFLILNIISALEETL